MEIIRNLFNLILYRKNQGENLGQITGETHNTINANKSEDAKKPLEEGQFDKLPNSSLDLGFLSNQQPENDTHDVNLDSENKIPLVETPVFTTSDDLKDAGVENFVECIPNPDIFNDIYSKEL